MARPLRIEYPGACYHVTNSGRRAEAVFLDKTDYRTFLGLLKEIAESGDLRVAAYCLTPNHYHLFVQTPNANLARCLNAGELY